MEDVNTRESYFLVIFFIVAVFYGVIPISGAFFSRYRWERFRKRFNDLRLSPLLNYRQYREMGNSANSEGGHLFRFTGEIESITNGQTLWVKGNDLTMPVSLEKTQCWLLPAHEGEAIPQAPEKIHWNRISTFNEGAKVYIGGRIDLIDNRLCFSSSKEKPLMVVFYNCPDTVLTDEIIQAARTRGEYWNSITPVSIVLGALAIVYIAVSFLKRPAFHITVISALVAMFTPVYPMFPPGILLTVLYRRVSWHARKYRIFRDLARLPTVYLGRGGTETAVLSTGEKYGFIKLDSLPGESAEKNGAGSLPYLIPEAEKKDKKTPWYFFGVLQDFPNEGVFLPVNSVDPFVSCGLLPGEPIQLARSYSIKAYSLEALAWLILLCGISINIVFIFLILFLLGIVSF